MNRRNFLLTTGAAAVSAGQMRGEGPVRRDHHLPETDRHYQRVKSYVEETPVPQYRWASTQAYEAFRDMKFGVRIHWGIYSVALYQKESWPFLSASFAERQKYNQIYKTWNPQAFHADAWMSLFQESGLKMLAFTTKHHEGFSMFDTKTRVRSRANWTAPGGPKMEACDLAYSIMETPFKRDIVGEICSAAHKRNLRIALYFSHPDWYDADFRPHVYHPLQVPSSAKISLDYEGAKKRLGDRLVIVPDPTPAEVNRMVMRHRDQLKELLTNYGQIDMLSLDMWLGPTVWPQLRETILEMRKIQPDVMLRARGIGNYGDYYTPEGFVPGSKENTTTPWMVIYPLAQGFAYDPDPAHYKGTGWIVSNLVDTVAKGGSFPGWRGAGCEREVSSYGGGAAAGLGAVAEGERRRHLWDAAARWRALGGGEGCSFQPDEGSQIYLCVFSEVAWEVPNVDFGEGEAGIGDQDARDSGAVEVA